MTQAWAVARQMIAEGIRMKIALVFLVLIGMVVLGVPLSASNDSSATDAVQSFMSFGLIATGVLLGMLTIFMSRSLSDELVNKQIFMVMTKPIPRWQYIFGKWLGITVLNAVFLAFAGLVIYGMVQYISRNPPKQDQSAVEREYDQRQLANEVLVARHARQMELPDFTRPALAEYERNLEEGRYASLPQFDPVQEKKRLAIKYEARWRIIGPLEARDFTFENVLCSRSREEIIQVRYKAEVSQYPPDEIFRAVWRFGDPLKGTATYTVPVRHVIDRFHTVRFPADAVAADQTLAVTLINQNPFEGEEQYRNVLEIRSSDGLEVLFVVGSFGWNLVRLLVLMMCKLMFLAAVALLMTTMLSFPVACLATFTIYAMAAARQFLAEALDWVGDDRGAMFSSFKNFFAQSVFYLYDMTRWILPNFGRYDAVEDLVNGRNVSLVWVLQGVTDLVLLKTTIVLAIAMLLFYRREVAEISF